METRIRGGDSSKRAEDSTVRAGELQMREAAMVSVKRKSMSTENSASGGSVKGEEQMIRWDRFLPRRFLKVLLVESDDSTRHIVAALLRKCSYQVAAVADGLKAWDILKDRNFNFDLVLTEVVMPSLSGIGLLSKIMSNEICKNIPVIMMSSHDSVGIVFKCMLKGAADFLVKPVRKNELRNLWQHVWRKCCSSNYGNGFENGNPECTKFEAVSENEDASNRGSANADGRSKIGDSSHAGSDTQSSCGNPDIEIESMQKQVVAFETEKRSFPEETDSKSDKYDTNSTEVALLSILENLKATDKSKDPEIEVSLSIHRALSSERVDEEAVSSVRSPCREKEPVHLGNKGSENIDTEPLNQQKGKDLPLDKVNEFIRAETAQRYGCHFSEDIGQDVLCVSAKSFDATRNGYYSRSSPLLELCLRRPQLEGPDEISLKKHVLKHSHVSAFSRYGKASSRPKPSSLCIKADDSGSSNCQIYPSDDKGKKSPFPISERSASSHGYGSEALELQRQLSSGSNKVDVGPSSCFPAGENACIGCSTTEKAFSPHPRLGFVPFSIPVGAIPFQSLSAGYGAVPPPVIYTEHSAPECSSSEVQKEMASTPSKPSTRNSCDLINNPQHVNCHVYDGNQHPHRLMQGLAEQRVKAETAFPRVHSHTPVENANLRGNFHCGMAIARGSNGSYENTSLAVNSAAAFENGNEDGFQTGNEKDGFQNGHGKDVDSDRSRREAALTKFRLKRKDRCFEKKVRYHNRKKLAEQRPRLKGQFVRQAVVELSTIAAESDD